MLTRMSHMVSSLVFVALLGWTATPLRAAEAPASESRRQKLRYFSKKQTRDATVGVSGEFLPLPNVSFNSSMTRETVYVLIPIGETNQRRLRRLYSLVLSLKGWPRSLMHVAMLASAGSVNIVRELAAELLKPASFGSVRVFGEPKGVAAERLGDAKLRHGLNIQRRRRAALARSRNYLWSVAIGRRRAHWTLWLDSDLLELPSSLLIDLRSTGVDIVAPACYCSSRDSCGDNVYDRNSWQHTPQSRAEVAALKQSLSIRKDQIILRGYREQRDVESDAIALKAEPFYLDDLRRHWQAANGSLGPLVPLHGLGATCIFVNTLLFRQGLIFPAFPVNHAIESEGLAQIALEMGIQPYGRVDLVIRHA